MRIMVVGANQGLNRAFIEGLGGNGDHLIGVSRRMPVSLPVRVLEQAGLVERRIEGRAHYCRLRPEPLAAAEQWLSFY